MRRFLEGTSVELETFRDSGIFYVAIHFGGDFWDHREFATEAEQMHFYNNPTLSERPKYVAETVDRSYLDVVEGPWRRLR